jgi:hypothetical protein
VFQYSCQQYARYQSSAGTKYEGVTSAKECAQLCASDNSCEAASWSSRSQCYLLSNKGFTTYPAPGSDFLLLVKTTLTNPYPLADGCEDHVDTAKAECKKNCDEQSKNDKLAALNDAKLQCQKEKDGLLQDERARYEQEKAIQAKTCDDEAGKRALHDCERQVVQATEQAQQVERAKYQDKLAGLEEQVKQVDEACTKEKDELVKKSNDLRLNPPPGEYGDILRYAPIALLCPKHDHAEFTGTNWDGTLSNWRIYCNYEPLYDTYSGGGSFYGSTADYFLTGIQKGTRVFLMDGRSRGWTYYDKEDLGEFKGVPSKAKLRRSDTYHVFARIDQFTNLFD